MKTEVYTLEKIPEPCSLTRHTFIEWIRYIKNRKESNRELWLVTDDKHPERNGYYIVLD